MAQGMLDRLLRGGEVAQEVLSALEAAFGPGAAEIDEVIKVGSGSVVLSGTFRGQEAVFKQFTGKDAAQTVSAAKAELAEMGAHLTDLYRVVPCLAALPEDGIIVLGMAPGQRMSTALKTATPDTRRALVAASGAWLRAASFRRDLRRFRATRFMQRLRDHDLKGFAPDDASLARDMLATLSRQADELDCEPLCFAIAHGDFAPVNLNVAGDVITAFDIQGGHYMPLPRIAARYLSAKDIFAPIGQMRHGLEAGDLNAFDREALLPGQGPVFRWFFGEPLFVRFVTSYAERGGHEGAKARLTHWMAEVA